MMATTHALVALAIAAPVAVAAPDLAMALAAGAVVGGLAPDLDLLLEHRRSLHFPVYGAVVAVLAVAVALVATTPPSVAVAAFVVAAWLHAASDAIGGGPGFDPWDAPIDRAVYDHRRGRWIRPRRWIRYDGAPEDAALGLLLAVPAVVLYEGWVRPLVAVGVAVSIGYALVRRRLPEWLESRS